ncbi:Ync [uncultured Candidatus Thioglobus sp.]|nr:Ync [uncultured Candidatus Thioglobus sp.]
MIDRRNPYYQHVSLLISLLPLIEEERCFALKGGTAINLFFQDLPRLSVDIDLTYLPVEDRETSLAGIEAALERIGERITSVLKGTLIEKAKSVQGNLLKLMVRRQGVMVKVEVSPVLRGSFLEPVSLDLSPSVEAVFAYTSMQLLDWHEVYAGKLCAALNRQLPRDLFDVNVLLEQEGITDELMELFIVYLISGNRPIAEMLAPRMVSLEASFNAQFKGTLLKQMSLQDLEKTREQLIETVNRQLTVKHKRFLLSFKAMRPQWSLLSLEGAEKLPAIRWKLLNLGKMSKQKHRASLDKLEAVLNGENNV